MMGLAPEAIPRAFIVPLGSGIEIASAGSEVLAHHIFIESDAEARAIGNIDPAMIDNRCLDAFFDEGRPPGHIEGMIFKREEILRGGGAMNVRHAAHRS